MNFQKLYSHTLGLIVVFLLSAVGSTFSQTTYFAKTSGEAQATSTWGVNPDGSGSSPASFNNPSDTFIVGSNRTTTSGDHWTVAGVLIVKDLGVLNQSLGNIFDLNLILKSGAIARLRGNTANNQINPLSLDINSTVEYRDLDYGLNNNAGDNTAAFTTAWSYGNLKFQQTQSTDKVTTLGVDVDIRGNLIISRGQFSLYMERPDPLPTAPELPAEAYYFTIGGDLIVESSGKFAAYNDYTGSMDGYNLDTVDIKVGGEIINSGTIVGIPNGFGGTVRIECDNFTSKNGGDFVLSNNASTSEVHTITINNKLTVENGTFTLNETSGTGPNIMEVGDIEVLEGSMIVSKASANGNSIARVKNSVILSDGGILKGNAEYGSTSRSNFTGGFVFTSGNTDTTFIKLSAASTNLDGGQNNITIQKGRTLELQSNIFLGDEGTFTLGDSSFLLMEDFYIKHVGTNSDKSYGRLVTSNESFIETKHPLGFGTGNDGALRGNRTTGSGSSAVPGNSFDAGTVLRFTHPTAQQIGSQISGFSIAEVRINTPFLTLGTGGLTIRDSLVYEPVAKRFYNKNSTGLFQLQSNCKIVGLDEDSTQNERFLNRITINSNGNSYFMPLSDSTSTLGNDDLDSEIYFPTTIATPGAERFETILYAFDANKNTTDGSGDNITRNNSTGIGQVNDYFYYHIYEPGIAANNEGNTTVDTITIPYHMEDLDNGYDTIGDPSSLIIAAYSRYDNGQTGSNKKSENRWRPINNITVDQVKKTVTGTYQIGAHFLRDADANGKAMHFALAGKSGSGNFRESVTARPNFEVKEVIATNDTFEVLPHTNYTVIETSIYEESTTWIFNGNVTFSNSNQDTTIVKFNETGVFEVKILNESRNGVLTTKSKFFKVLPVAIAKFTVDNTEGCSPATFNFTSISKDADSVFYEITGPETASSNQDNPAIVLTAPGTYTVKLKAFNANKNDSITKTELIEVFDCSLPVAAFTQDITGGCDAITVNFTNTSTKFDKSTWIFDGGTPQFSNNENQTVSYTKKGSFDVTLIVENLYGKDTLEIKGLINVVDCEAAFTSDVTEICPDGSVSFSNTSATSTSVEWTFPGGTPATSTDENPTVTYATTGDYSVTLEATNEFGSKEITTTDYINVLDCDLPTMSFTNGDTSDCDSVQVTFTNSGTKFDKVLWIFEGGQPNTSNALNPTVWFRQQGQFDVTLIGENAYGKDTIIKADHISTFDCIAPVSKFASDITEGCPSFDVTFENKSFQHDSVVWVFEGGVPATSTLDNPVVTYANTGSFQVQLISINDNERDTLTIENYITALDCSLPTALFTQDKDTDCDTAVVTFTNQSTKFESSFWIFEGGSPEFSFEDNPTVSFNNSGTYDVTLIVKNKYGSDTLKMTDLITVENCTNPVASFTSDVNSGCKELTVNYTNTSEKFDDVAWEFEGGDPAVSADVNPTVVYGLPGTYNVKLTATNEYGETIVLEEDFITVQACDVPVADFTNDKSEGCQDEVVTFTNESENYTSLLWIFEGGSPATSTVESPMVTYPNVGTYTVELIATNQNGKDTVKKTSLISITDCDLPTVDFTATETTVCAPTNIVFSPDVEKGDTYLWTFEKGSGTPETSTLKNPKINYSIEGVYSVTLEVTNVNGAATETKTDYITVENCDGLVPVGDFDFEIVPQALVNFTNTSNVTGDDATYSWNFGDGTSKSADESPTHQFTADGSYDVTMIIRNDAGSDTVTKTVDIVGVSVANIINPEDIKVYPNPVSSVLNVEVLQSFENIEVTIFDIAGKVIINSRSEGNTTQLTMAGLAKGTYVLEIKSGDKFHRELILKQ